MAQIGLLSDSHGAGEITQRAVELLIAQGADLLVHLGDICSMSVLEALVASGAESQKPVEAHLVFGNVDWDADSLSRYARDLGLIVDHPVGRLDVEGKSMIFLHGDDMRAMDRALAEQPDYICHGHSHQMRDEKVGTTRLINPGALSRATVYTVALLDTQTDSLGFHEIQKA